MDFQVMTSDNSDLLDERLSRLRTFLKISAPISIISTECELVLRSFHGNSRWKVIEYLIYTAIYDSFQISVVNPIIYKLHKLGIYHPKDEDGKCYFCEFEKEIGVD